MQWRYCTISITCLVPITTYNFAKKYNESSILTNVFDGTQIHIKFKQSQTCPDLDSLVSWVSDTTNTTVPQQPVQIYKPCEHLPDADAGIEPTPLATPLCTRPSRYWVRNKERCCKIFIKSSLVYLVSVTYLTDLEADLPTRRDNSILDLG